MHGAKDYSPLGQSKGRMMVKHLLYTALFCLFMEEMISSSAASTVQRFFAKTDSLRCQHPDAVLDVTSVSRCAAACILEASCLGFNLNGLRADVSRTCEVVKSKDNCEYHGNFSFYEVFDPALSSSTAPSATTGSGTPSVGTSIATAAATIGTSFISTDASTTTRRMSSQGTDATATASPVESTASTSTSTLSVSSMSSATAGSSIASTPSESTTQMITVASSTTSSATAEISTVSSTTTFATPLTTTPTVTEETTTEETAEETTAEETTTEETTTEETTAEETTTEETTTEETTTEETTTEETTTEETTTGETTEDEAEETTTEETTPLSPATSTSTITTTLAITSTTTIKADSLTVKCSETPSNHAISGIDVTNWLTLYTTPVSLEEEESLKSVYKGTECDSGWALTRIGCWDMKCDCKKVGSPAALDNNDCVEVSGKSGDQMCPNQKIAVKYSFSGFVAPVHTLKCCTLTTE